MQSLTVKATFIEPVLGTLPANKDIASDYVASKAPDYDKMEEEIERIGVSGVVEKGKTIFPKDDNGNPIFWDYQIKGFLKEAIGILKDIKGNSCTGLKAYKKKVDNFVFVFPRRIPIQLSGEMTDCQRPLRAMTPMGERISLANSEEIPAGSTIEFTIKVLNDDMLDMCIDALDYAELKGIGGWRNSGKGRITYEILGAEVK